MSGWNWTLSQKNGYWVAVLPDGSERYLGLTCLISEEGARESYNRKLKHRLEKPSEKASALGAKVLMQGGKWLVPPEQRPSDWRKILDEPEYLGAVVEETAKQADLLTRYREYLEEVKADLADSARAMGARGILLLAAKVLLSGMFFRDAQTIATEIGEDEPSVSEIAERFERDDIWKRDKSVYLGVSGEIDDPNGDLGFWLVAMVGAGYITVDRWESGEPVFKALPQ